MRNVDLTRRNKSAAIGYTLAIFAIRRNDLFEQPPQYPMISRNNSNKIKINSFPINKKYINELRRVIFRQMLDGELKQFSFEIHS